MRYAKLSSLQSHTHYTLLSIHLMFQIVSTHECTRLTNQIKSQIKSLPSFECVKTSCHMRRARQCRCALCLWSLRLCFCHTYTPHHRSHTRFTFAYEYLSDFLKFKIYSSPELSVWYLCTVSAYCMKTQFIHILTLGFFVCTRCLGQ